MKIPRRLYEQYAVLNNKAWHVPRLIRLAKNIQTSKIKIKQLHLEEYSSEKFNSLGVFILEVNRILKSNLNYPILLTSDGIILDGFHRACKAKLLGKKYIKCKIFFKLPSTNITNWKKSSYV